MFGYYDGARFAHRIDLLPTRRLYQIYLFTECKMIIAEKEILSSETAYESWVGASCINLWYPARLT